MKFQKLVCYIHEVILIKHAEPNQLAHFVSYNRDYYNKVWLYLRIICRISEEYFCDMCIDEDVEVLSSKSWPQESFCSAEPQPVLGRRLHMGESVTCLWVKSKWKQWGKVDYIEYKNIVNLTLKNGFKEGN